MLLSEMTREDLEAYARETQADLYVALSTKQRVLDKNKQLTSMVVDLQTALGVELDRVEILERENYQLIKKLRDNGLL